MTTKDQELDDRPICHQDQGEIDKAVQEMKAEAPAQEQKPEPFRVMDPSQISMIETDCKKMVDTLRLSKDWGESVIDAETNPKGNRSPKIEGTVSAHYPLEYVLDFLKVVKKEKVGHVKLIMAEDRPLRIEAKVQDYDGSEKIISFILAPRIVEGD